MAKRINDTYDQILFGRGNQTGTVLEQYCGDESVPVLDAIERILLVLEKQFTENIRCYKEKLKDEQFR